MQTECHRHFANQISKIGKCYAKHIRLKRQFNAYLLSMQTRTTYNTTANQLLL